MLLWQAFCSWCVWKRIYYSFLCLCKFFLKIYFGIISHLTCQCLWPCLILTLGQDFNFMKATFLFLITSLYLQFSCFFSQFPVNLTLLHFLNHALQFFLFCLHLALSMAGGFQRLWLWTSCFAWFNLTTLTFAAEPPSIPCHCWFERAKRLNLPLYIQSYSSACHMW